MKQKLKYFIILFIVNLILAFQAKSQVYPVQLNTQLIPPYSLRLSDYVAPGTNRIGLNMLLTDLNELNYQVRLELTIEGNGITIKTSPLFNPQPIILDGGVPQYFTSSDLAAWFDPQNLDFSGYSKSAYLSSGRLPEGVYRFYFTVLDYNKHIRVSNNIPVTAWLMLNDPPLINLPFPNHKVEHIDPQNIVFQWTPRHTASPNSAFSAEYEFTLVEIWPEGRDPNNAIQTSIPVYQTTTTNTTLVYGLAEPFLEPGKQYAYRVQARDVDGRDMFKNNGYSEVRMFTFGEECKPITNITSEVKRFNEALISWTPGFTNTSFTVRYRKANTPSAEWFEENRFVSDVTLNDLQAQTTYEYQVMAYCGTYDSDYSDIQTFTTPEPAVSSFECGKSADSTLIANTTPLPVLRKRDFIWSGDFMVQITEVSGGNGNFSGKGLALVPYLGFVKLAVEFESIKVNTEKQVFEGEIKSVYNPNSPFIFTVDLDGPDYDSSGDSTITTGGGGLNDTTFVTDIDSVFIDGDNIFIVNEDGTTDTIPTTDDIIITDSNGDTWVVENGDVIVGDGNGPGGGSGSGSGSLPVADVTDIKIKLEFLPYKDQEYGFDKLSYDIHKPTYEQASVYGESVYLPWKSLSAASMDRILVKFSDFDTTITPEKVRFRNAVGENLTSYAFEDKNDQRLVLLNGQTSLEAQTIEAYVAFKDTSNKEQELVVGKFNTISYEKENINVVLVPVNGPSPFAVADFVNALNDIYKQAAISWTVTLQSQYDIDKSEWDLDDDNKLNDGESTLLSSYSDEQNKLKRKYKHDRDIDNKTYYVFLLNGINSKTGLAGYMPIKGQYGFIYPGSTDARTIAHELGHGAFRLWHTFSDENEYIMAQNSSDNLMDYNNGQRLHKYQWDYIHNPETVLFEFLQDEEEGAMKKGTFTVWVGDSIMSDKKVFICPNNKTKLYVKYIPANNDTISKIGLRVYIKIDGQKDSTVTNWTLNVNQKMIIGLDSLPDAAYKLTFKDANKISFYVRRQKYDFACSVCGRNLELTGTELKLIFPNSKKLDDPLVIQAFNNAFKKSEFKTCNHFAHFLAQLQTESIGLTKTNESTKYYLHRLFEVFRGNNGTKFWYEQDFWDNKTYLKFVSNRVYEKMDSAKYNYSVDSTDYETFTHKSTGTSIKIPKDYSSHAKPHTIAFNGYKSTPGKGYYSAVVLTDKQKEQNGIRSLNVAYMGMDGNSPDTSWNNAEGYKYRGRGYVQVTNKNNYIEAKSTCATKFQLNYDFVNNPDLMANDTIAVWASFAWFIKNITITDLNTENPDIITYKVNKAGLDADDRKKNYNDLRQKFFKCNKP
ncbi:MAG: fibronectin type III domain-containing protein [Bacteroidales bacterium]|jgi:predicted chitinase|nr:fibronectin type III domain-containing protein [Bacteroidales bacterium]